MTVDDLREILADLPGYHIVMVDALNGSPPRPLSAVSRRTQQDGPSVVVW